MVPVGRLRSVRDQEGAGVQIGHQQGHQEHLEIGQRQRILQVGIEQEEVPQIC